MHTTLPYRVPEVPPVYKVVQCTVRANQTHKGQPECALEIALLIYVLLLRQYMDVEHPQTKIGVESERVCHYVLCSVLYPGPALGATSREGYDSCV